MRNIDSPFKLLSPIQSTTAANMIIMAFGMISGVLTARFLGPSGRGEIAAAVVWPATIATIGTLGIPDAMVYQSGRRKEIGRLIATGLLLGLLQLAVMGILGMFIIPRALAAQGDHVVRLSLIYLLFLFYAFVGNYAVGIILGATQFNLWNALRLLNPVLYLAAIVTLWCFGAVTSENVLIVMLLGPVATTIAACSILYSLNTEPIALDWRTTIAVVRYGFESALSTFPLFLRENLAQIIMSTVMSSAELGLYSVAVVAASPMSPLFNAFQTVIFPKTAAEPDSGIAKRVLTRDIASGMWTSALLLVGLELFLPYLIRLFYGAEYALSVLPAQVLTGAVFIAGLGQMLAAGFRGLGMPRVSVWGNGIGLVVMAILLPTFLSRWGLLGAAWASFLSSFAALLCLLYMIRSRAGLSLRKLLRPQFGNWSFLGRFAGPEAL